MTDNVLCTNITHFQASTSFQSCTNGEEMEGTLQTDNHVLMIGLSGPTSAGKTTLAHLLKHVFPNMLSFYTPMTSARSSHTSLPSTAILPVTDPEGVDFASMVKTLDYIRANAGKAPPDFKTWQADVLPG